MNKPKIILGIETSCDETAAAVLKKTGNRVTILSNIIASSASLQAKYGGVIPEQAAREQIKSIIPVIQEALSQAFPFVIPARFAGASARRAKAGIHTNNLWIPDQVRNDIVGKIDAIAVTQGPGLIGSLLVGVETAKTLALVWDKPLIPVNHLLGHFYANWITKEKVSKEVNVSKVSKAKNTFDTSDTFDTFPPFPCIGLLVSGGHTDLVLFRDHGKYEYLGGTRDDAAGECFDKCARLLDLPYPGGPNLAKLAEKGNPNAIKLPRPMIDSGDFDFSFSGLKTAVANFLKENPSVIPSETRNLPSKSTLRPGKIATSVASLLPRNDNKKILNGLAASIQQAIIDVLVEKTVRAAQTFKVDQIMVAGGVAANQELNRKFKVQSSKFKIKLHVPPAELCTDNAAMVASAAFFNHHPIDPLTLQASPSLNLSDLTISH